MDIDKRVGLPLKLDHKDDTKSPELIAANVTSQSHESIEKEMAEFKLVELNENLDANVRVNLNWTETDDGRYRPPGKTRTEESS